MATDRLRQCPRESFCAGLTVLALARRAGTLRMGTVTMEAKGSRAITREGSADCCCWRAAEPLRNEWVFQSR